MNNKQVQGNKLGFTLIEILLVVAAIGILASIVIVAINPGKQLAEARNAQRRTDINTILNAVYQYSIDHSGVLPDTITTDSIEICKTDASDCSGKVDLSAITANQKYLVKIPSDPLSDSSNSSTYYAISKTEFGRLSVYATHAELNVDMRVTR